ncbi:MAG: hypothetical protein J0I99_09215 [Devosia sp.]|uniref:hypothetical protein n=1 Tax=Devosia sp. TaxID=1871048 RepID=UPI001ACE0F4B|nr:hypothetical protein [Devosia sp.]MBN9315904.1 hypothetical protein [Devosia sp.]
MIPASYLFRDVFDRRWGRFPDHADRVAATRPIGPDRPALVQLRADRGLLDPASGPRRGL